MGERYRWSRVFLETLLRNTTTSPPHTNLPRKKYSVSLSVKVRCSNQLGMSGSREHSVLDGNRNFIRTYAATQRRLVPIVWVKPLLGSIHRKPHGYEISEVKLVCWMRSDVWRHDSSMTTTGTFTFWINPRRGHGFADTSDGNRAHSLSWTSSKYVTATYVVSPNFSVRPGSKWTTKLRYHST